MAVEVDIANAALIALGARTITSLLQPDSKEALVCQRRMLQARQAELRAHLWGFALKRASLAASATAPVWGYTLAYPYPADALRIVQVGDFFVGSSLTDARGTDESLYALEQRQILTNLAAPLKIRYVAEVTDASQFDALFSEALAYRLAWSIAPELTLSTTSKDSLQRDYMNVVQQAVAVNSIEKPPVQLPDDSFLTSRL